MFQLSDVLQFSHMNIHFNSSVTNLKTKQHKTKQTILLYIIFIFNLPYIIIFYYKKSKQTKQTKTNSNQNQNTKSNQTKPNQTKPNQTKLTYLPTYLPNQIIP